MLTKTGKLGERPRIRAPMRNTTEFNMIVTLLPYESTRKPEINVRTRGPSELQIGRDNEDKSKIIFLISQ